MTAVEVDRSLCCGYERCTQIAPDSFRMDDKRKSVATAPDGVEIADVVRAAEACPMQAITVWGPDGAQVFP